MRSPVTNVVSALTARTQFGQIIRRASQRDERFVVGRRGEPKVIIMGVRDYIKSLAPAPTWLRQVRQQARKKGLDQLTRSEINREIAAHRRTKRSR